MKNIFKAIGIFVSAFVLSGAAALAQEQQSFTIQLEDKTLPVGDFSTINATGDFEVTLDKGDYGVRLTVDNALSPYVQVYVRAKTLYIGYDEKSVPKDIKKLYKQKNASAPTFRAVVTLPELAGITVADNAVINSAVEFPGEYVTISLADKAQIKSLSVNSVTANVTMAKNTQAVLSLKADDKIEITNEGNSNLKLSANTGNLVVNGNGNATISIGAETPVANVNGAANSKIALVGLCGKGYLAANSKIALAAKADKIVAGGIANTKIVLSGETTTLEIRTEKNAEIDGDGLLTKEVIANLNGNSRANVNVSETIEATILGGSSLFYTGTPAFKIGRVIKSTLAPKGAPVK